MEKKNGKESVSAVKRSIGTEDEQAALQNLYDLLTQVRFGDRSVLLRKEIDDQALALFEKLIEQNRA